MEHKPELQELQPRSEVERNFSRQCDLNRELVKELQDLRTQTTLQINRLVNRLSNAQDRLTKLHHVETAIVNFHLEVLERTKKDTDWEEDDKTRLSETLVQEQHHDVLANAGNDILVVFDQLRANIRIQLSLVEDRELDLTNRLVVTKDNTRENERNLRLHVAELERQLTELKLSREGAIRQMEQSNRKKDQIALTSRQAIEKANTTTQSWQLKHKAVEEKNERLVAEIEASRQSAQDHKAHLHKVEELEARTQRQTALLAEKDRLLHAKTSLKPQISKEEKRYMIKLENTNVQLEQTLAQLKQQLNKMNLNMRLVNVKKTEQRANKAIAAEEKLRQDFEKLQSEYHSTQAELKRSEEKLGHLEEEHKKLRAVIQKRTSVAFHPKTSAAVKQKAQTATSKKLSDSEAHRQAAENPYLIDYYKRRGKEHDIEMKGLRAKFKRVLASEHENRLLFQTCERDRRELQRRCEMNAYEKGSDIALRPRSAAATTRNPRLSRSSSMHGF